MKKYTKHLIPLDEFIDVIAKRNLIPSSELKAIKEYRAFLKTKPKRTDLINFDNEGFYIDDNNTLFKGFVTCDESSSEEKKVAVCQNTRIYFFEDDKKDVVVYHENFVTDECTYNEVAIAFNKKNGLKPLEFA